ncbi:LCP family protein [Streptomonospora salina]|uniref:LCP family protein required for cell wall assembly n=1 Tax=Streptomonospora salina TaxID=104205 RepID=A0A841E2I7_9ACTN|nr:LCP family protein [Streptomonospora salina]MBB5997355.1 LCP family protein required for cell wall assembly [Streptomonospora salina]
MAPSHTRHRARSRARRVAASVCIVLLVLVAAAAGAVVWRTGAYDAGIDRISGALPEDRASADADPGENWLVVGSDLRGEATAGKWRSGESGSDVIILVHMPADADRVFAVSFPRDSWVPIPGHGTDKINEAYRQGGSRLLVRTVERFSGVAIDHFAAVDFAGFERMVDALGGVTLDLPREIRDPTNGWHWEQGENDMDGEEALRFVRERKGLSGSDIDRVARQQVFLNAIAEKAASDLASDPGRLDAFLTAAGESLAVDDRVTAATLQAAALRLLDAGPDNAVFVTLAVDEPAWIDGKNVLRLDTPVNDGLFAALEQGRLHAYVDEHDLANDARSLN